MKGSENTNYEKSAAAMSPHPTPHIGENPAIGNFTGKNRDGSELSKGHEIDMSENDGGGNLNNVHDYKFLSGAGSIKKPEKVDKLNFDSGKTTQIDKESSKISESKQSSDSNESSSSSEVSESFSITESIRQSVGSANTEYNEILELLRNSDKTKTAKCLRYLQEHQTWVKTALMMPIEEFAGVSPKNKIEMKSYLNYSPSEELYGLFLVIKNKNLKIFNHLWNELGFLWWHTHIIPLLKNLVHENWSKGIYRLFLSERVHEIFYAFDFNEKKLFFSEIHEICRKLDSTDSKSSQKILKAIISALCDEPYAIFSFLLLFPFVHKTRTQIEDYDIKPEVFSEDIFLIANDTNLLHELATTFDKVCKGNHYEKATYHSIIISLINCPYVNRSIPFRKIWKSIKQNDIEQLRNCWNSYSNEWSRIISMRPCAASLEFKEPKKDDRVNKLKLHQWKPLHLMLYYQREQMIVDIIEFAGSSTRKAITLENKKKYIEDDFMCLKICISLKNKFSFHALWKIPNLWSVGHLYKVLEELRDPDVYDENIHRIILKSKTTKDILEYCNPEIKAEFTKIMKSLKSFKHKKRKTEALSEEK